MINRLYFPQQSPLGTGDIDIVTDMDTRYVVFFYRIFRYDIDRSLECRIVSIDDLEMLQVRKIVQIIYGNKFFVGKQRGYVMGSVQIDVARFPI